MSSTTESIEKLSKKINKEYHRPRLSFNEFLDKIANEPYPIFRNIFQLFNDFIHHYMGEGVNEYPDDPETINYAHYDSNKLFVEGADNPFFADRLFANRLIDLTKSLKRGSQQNKIYLFEGPHGSGKSTFLNNLLSKFEEYTNAPEGTVYETVWILDKKKLGWKEDFMLTINQNNGKLNKPKRNQHNPNKEFLEVPCPSHDNPILVIPKSHRKELLEDIIKDEEFKKRLFNEKEYEWVFKRDACTICTSLYQALLDKLGSPSEVFNMLVARKYRFSKRLGEGISVFNASDDPPRINVMTNEMIQEQLAELFGDSNKVQYVFSRYAKTNNGIYALMDIKDHNQQRLMNLHGIISEGLHKVEDLEENVNSLFIGVINPEDKIEEHSGKHKEKMKAFLDRLDYTRLPYVMDYHTEVEIYKSIFGKQIENNFLPRVLNEFAKVIISSRLNTESEAIDEWFNRTYEYRKYCDENFLLLKMEIYNGVIPPWVSEEHRKGFTAKIRKKLILEEADKEGFKGVSGRKSIELFNELYSTFAKKNRLITMANVTQFFLQHPDNLCNDLPEGFLDSLKNLYDYTVLQEVKESLYYYNQTKISKDIQNYLFAISYDGEKVGKIKCAYTGETLDVSEDFFETIELRILGSNANYHMRQQFRTYTQKEYASKTLTQEMQLEGKKITETDLYKNLRDRYVRNIKEKVLDPFVENLNFRNAIKDYDTKEFNTYDRRIREDVNYLIKNLKTKFDYTEEGAKQVCIYVMDNDLARKFS